jgi:hypothetical protein
MFLSHKNYIKHSLKPAIFSINFVKKQIKNTLFSLQFAHFSPQFSKEKTDFTQTPLRQNETPF